MRFVLAFLSVLLTLCLGPSAYADVVFNLTGTLQDGTGVFNGTLTYIPNYSSYGRVTGTITDGAYSFTVPSSYLGETLNEGSYTHVDVFSVGAAYDLSLYVPNSILVAYAGGALCSLSAPCGAPTYTIVSSFGDYDRSGNALFARQSFQTLTATPQVTPEPDTFVLLGSGMLAIGGVVKRRTRYKRLHSKG